MLLFIIIGTLGLMLVIISMVLGEFIEIGDGALSGTSLGVGGLVFGAVGVITHANDLPEFWTYAGSAFVAILVVILVQVALRRLRDTEDGLPFSLEGVPGIATSDISATGGEVNLDHPREIERRMAWSDEPIPEGARIVVLLQSGSRVKVEKAEA